jgi:DNA repair exonuclease SbcCD ATPase subunit
LISAAGTSDSQRLIATCLHALFSSNEAETYTPENQQTIEFAIRSFICELPRTNSDSSVPESVDVISFHRENAQAIQRHQSIRHSLEAEISALRSELEVSKEKVQGLNDQLQIKTYQEERYKAEVKELSRALTERHSEIRELRNGLEVKKKQIETLDIQNRQSTLKIQKFTRTNRRPLNEKRGGDVPVTGVAIALLTAECEKQSQELISLHNSQSQSLGLITNQNRLIDEFANQISLLSEQCQKFEADQNQVSQNQFRLTELETIISDLQALTVVPDITDLPDFVKSLMEAGLAENQRLQAAFDQLLSFTSSLIGSPIVAVDGDIIRREVARYRQFMNDHELNAGDVSYDSVDPREMAVELIRADLLMEHCAQLQEEAVIVQQIAEIFHFSGDKHQL